ncbi:dynein heavy chain axonemal [Labeo rohita]|uniref:ribonuclease H n=1 Tax=Labeo rohita TaxID=84645 RepID=A0A498MGG6_LABRO|nr:dynein heavy chain axonemal [Labeo rohita]
MELKRMEDLGVIVKQTEPTDWVNSMVTVLKPEKLRICIDPQDLNKAIKREHYPLRTIEEIVAEMPNAKVFSVLDANHGFWQVHLDEVSSKLCTFNTPFGRYRFLRLPFGIVSAPEVFQKCIAQRLEGLDGVVNIVDDILVWGEDMEQHNKRLRKLLDRIRDINLKLNKTKCKIRMTEVSYVGHILTAEGLKPDNGKVRAIQNMPEPQDKAALMRFLGLLQYLSKFIPNMSDLSAPLRKLLEGDVAWHWETEQQRSFERLKSLVSNTPVLKYFDVNKEIMLSVDASAEGLGAVLLQEGHPVAFGSRSLTECQKRYAQIEKELLAIVYGCEKFHQYVYGKTVQVETDHKPLETVFKKSLQKAPPRLQRMLMRLQLYDIRSNTKEPLICHDIPDRAWAKVGVHLFHFNQEEYLMCVDYFSKFQEIAKLTQTTSKHVVTALKSIFARHGIPEEVVSDNGPQFSSAEFRAFTESWEFGHATSSPGFPQANGQSERAIQTVKNLLKKAQESQRDPYIALLEYRNAPMDGVKLSPAQMLMGRRLKTKLPTSTKLLRPQLYRNVHKDIKDRQLKQKSYFDCGAKQLPPIATGEKVRVKVKNNWQPAIVLRSHEKPRSFVIQRPDGNVFRRNRRDLLKTREVTFSKPRSVELDECSSDNSEFAESNTSVQSPALSPVKRPVTPVADMEVQGKRSRWGRLIKPPKLYSP